MDQTTKQLLDGMMELLQSLSQGEVAPEAPKVETPAPAPKRRRDKVKAAPRAKLPVAPSGIKLTGAQKATLCQGLNESWRMACYDFRDGRVTTAEFSVGVIQLVALASSKGITDPWMR